MLSKHYAINQVELMNIYNMYKLLCIIYNLHESCYTWYLWRLNVHDICFVRFGTGVPDLCLLFLNWYIHIVKVSVSNFFNSFQIIFNFVHGFLYFLWQSWDRGILITISDSSIFISLWIVFANNHNHKAQNICF